MLGYARGKIPPPSPMLLAYQITTLHIRTMKDAECLRLLKVKVGNACAYEIQSALDILKKRCLSSNDLSEGSHLADCDDHNTQCHYV